MKKTFVLLILATTSSSMLVGCGSESNNQANNIKEHNTTSTVNTKTTTNNTTGQNSSKVTIADFEYMFSTKPVEEKELTAEEQEELDSYLNKMQELRDELEAEYKAQLEHCDLTRWARFRQEHNEKIEQIQVPKSANIDQLTMPTDLKLLANSYGKNLQGRGDSNYDNWVNNELNKNLN